MTVPIVNYARKVRRVKRVHDGDTFLLELDQGLGDGRECWLRLAGIDTPELSQPGGVDARDFVESVFSNAHEIVVQTFKRSSGEDVTSFIRYVADVWVDGVALAGMLRSAGFEKA